MSYLPAAPAGTAKGAARLFDPGQRIGWTYRDPATVVPRFPEPYPVEHGIPRELPERAERTAGRSRVVAKAVLLWCGGAAAVFAVLGITVSHLFFIPAAAFAAFALLVCALCALVAAGARRRVVRTRQRSHRRFEEEVARWNAGRERFEQEQRRLTGTLDLWGGMEIAPGTRRIDVFGGSRRSREGLLTVFGTSTMPQRPLILLDLTMTQIYQELAIFSSDHGVAVDVQLLPGRQEQSNILEFLEPRELVDVLVESLHGDTAEATRAERGKDTRILGRLCEALNNRVTPARIGAGLRVLLGEYEDTDQLTRAEQSAIADDLLSDKNKDQARDSLMRLEALIQPLETLGRTRNSRAPGYLTCLALERTAGSANTELLADLMLLSVTRRLATMPEEAPTVVVALGEQDVQPRYLEQLASVCEWRSAQLMLVHPRLRETGRSLIGGGAVAFMRLGNHEEAETAANYMGRGYSFKFHSLTDTAGENISTSIARTTGTSTSVGTTTGSSRNWGRSWGSNGSNSYAPGEIFSTNRGHGWNSGGNDGYSTNESTSTTYGTNDSTSVTDSSGTNTSRAHSVQRVYEYALEPTQLQALGEFSLLFVDRRQDGSVVAHPVTCNPNIVMLDRVSSSPLPADPGTAAPSATPAVGQAQPAQPAPLAPSAQLPQSAPPAGQFQQPAPQAHQQIQYQPAPRYQQPTPHQQPAPQYQPPVPHPQAAPPQAAPPAAQPAAAPMPPHAQPYGTPLQPGAWPTGSPQPPVPPAAPPGVQPQQAAPAPPPQPPRHAGPMA